MEYIISNRSILSSLSPRALKVYNFLCEKANRITNSSFWRRSKIAAACAMSESTFARALRELKLTKLVAVQERFETCGRQKSNEYFLLGQDKPLTMPSVELVKALKGNNLKVYLYLNKRCGTASYRVAMKDIANSCRIAPKTAQKCVAYLKRHSYIQAEAQNRLDAIGDMGTGYNLYTVIRAISRSHLKRPIYYKCILCALLVSQMTPSPTSEVTPPLTLSKLKVTNKKKIGDVSLATAQLAPEGNESASLPLAKSCHSSTPITAHGKRPFDFLLKFPAFLSRLRHRRI